jgi:4-hydroxy-tetrahydrodipicolinate reductase
MKIILLGYGKMGKVIEQVALQRGHQIAARIDIDNPQDLETVQGDVVIEFSHPNGAFENISKCLRRNLPVVCGTTGWLSRKSDVEVLCQQTNGTFFYSSNYSLGVNIFFKLNQYLAVMMDKFPDYDVSLEETHHTEKKDAPSGTAITLAEGILKNLPRKKVWVNQKTADNSNLMIESFRIDQVPGTHVIQYKSTIDDIEIKHTAHSREGFGRGAVMVAEWILDKKGILGMDDYLRF